jgi:hypothetical protein
MRQQRAGGHLAVRRNVRKDCVRFAERRERAHMSTDRTLHYLQLLWRQRPAAAAIRLPDSVFPAVHPDTTDQDGVAVSVVPLGSR